MYWGAGRDSRYSVARRGIGNQGYWGAPRSVRVLGLLWGIRQCRGCQGCIGGWQGL